MTIPESSQATVSQVRVWPAPGLIVFDVRSRGGERHPSIEAIQAKLLMDFGREPPVELLAYYSIQELDPASQQWLDDLDKLLDERLESCSFRRVWVFNYARQRIEYVRPTP